MNVNKANHFEKSGVITRKRLTRFNMPHGLHTTFDSGKLVPIYLQEVLPNDVKKLKWSGVTRLLTPKFPTMDNAKLDTFFFFVPNRLIWEHWKEFLGENNSSESPWTQPVTYTIPQTIVPLDPTLRKVGDLADYLGIPINKATSSGLSMIRVSSLPFRAVAKIWNDWFRDENYELPAYYKTNDNETLFEVDTGTSDGYIKHIECGSVCPPVNRYKDYFSSVLPAPQKGAAVRIPLGQYAPIVAGGTPAPLTISTSSAGANLATLFFSGSGTEGVVGASTGDQISGSTAGRVGVNLKMQTDLSSATAASVNALRLAFQTQKFLEESARGGTRYTELLFSMFGANAPDAVLQRSEFLGGKSFPISIQPVTNIGESSDLGTVGGMSNTVSGDYAFKKHFTEHGYIIGLACVRSDRSYSQGIQRHWFRKDKLDFYFPVFANIGEQPVYGKELFVTGSNTGAPSPGDNSAIGYQEAWAEYRFAINEASGYLRSGINESLNAWTYTDEYDSLPTIGAAWLFSQKELIDRTIVNQNKHQFIADFYFDDVSYRVLPAYSIPGLIDHG